MRGLMTLHFFINIYDKWFGLMNFKQVDTAYVMIWLKLERHDGISNQVVPNIIGPKPQETNISSIGFNSIESFDCLAYL